MLLAALRPSFPFCTPCFLFPSLPQAATETQEHTEKLRKCFVWFGFIFIDCYSCILLWSVQWYL